MVPVSLTRDGAVRKMLIVRSTAKEAALTTSFAPSPLPHHYIDAMTVAASNASEPTGVVGSGRCFRSLHGDGEWHSHATPLHGHRTKHRGDAGLLDIYLVDDK
ncbi:MULTISPECIES: hypothetical protein [Mesorhizobium]|uniref:hypothetical protein n=1 Tax=Mesorhizobium TaxID=68287 RepID=UPI00101279D3|nr:MULTISPECIES: hypothetical protein [Mesorhizobium]